jgi:hypothetical protein
MRISLTVPYGADLSRRTLTFLARSQLRPTRILSGVVALLGLLIALVDRTNPLGYAVLAGGVVLLFGLVPFTAFLARFPVEP